jgi:glycosyltransferase involved in cell wall biosynthesis
MRHLRRYLNLQQLRPAVMAPPERQLRLIAVIPCLNEPGMIELLNHLHHCALPDGIIEIIIVINHAADAPEKIRRCNLQTYADIRDWQAQRISPALPAHVIPAFDLPPKHAGVGLARKIGMDEAMRRFAAIEQPQGVIASLDADCRVSGNYFTALTAAFDAQPDMHAATVAWAHPVDAIADLRQRHAMICYELFLRYIEQGWRYANLPYAFTAIGSCFALRANACARHHGMNKRKAGEDFYFLHKLARERPLGRIDAACVYPSARMKSRTPFGTGQAIADWYNSASASWSVCDPARFDELKCMHDQLGDLFSMQTEIWLKGLPHRLSQYLQASDIASAVEGMRGNAASGSSFQGRFFVWFDGLKAWRYVNQEGAQQPVEQAAASLLRICGMASPPDPDARALLMRYRQTNGRAN